jgi:hypothetical protein
MSEWYLRLMRYICIQIPALNFLSHNNNNNNNLTIEIQRIWNVKTRVIPVILGATGTISKSFRKYVSTIPGNHEMKLRNYRKLPYWHCTHTLESADVEVHWNQRRS